MLPFYYNQQLKRYIVQFMHLFNGMQVQVGKTSNREAGLINVPVHYSSMDKVAASIVAGGTMNKPVRVPVMSVEVMGIRQDPNGVPGLNQMHSQTYLPEGGYFATDVKTLTRLRPAPYILDLDLAIWTSNTDQQFQVMEQILTIFNPSIQIQTSDQRFDWTKISTVTLNDITMTPNYPIGNGNKVIMTNLGFELPICLSAPAEVRDEFVRDVFIRLAALESGADMDNILATMDDLEVEYTNVASADDILDKLQG